MPFRDNEDLEEHFEDHKAEFPGITRVQSYLILAERFLNGPLSPTAVECLRPQGGRCRYDRVTEEYGAVRADGTIATYFRPNPAIHGLASNMEYYLLHCR